MHAFQGAFGLTRARPGQQLETTLPTVTPTTSPPLRLLEHSSQKAACPGPQEEDGVGIDRIGCHRHTHSLSVSYTTPHCHCLTMHARFLFCFSGKHPLPPPGTKKMRFRDSRFPRTLFVLEANRECGVTLKPYVRT
jgi:hypothetical protein